MPPWKFADQGGNLALIYESASQMRQIPIMVFSYSPLTRLSLGAVARLSQFGEVPRPLTRKRQFEIGVDPCGNRNETMCFIVHPIIPSIIPSTMTTPVFPQMAAHTTTIIRTTNITRMTIRTVHAMWIRWITEYVLSCSDVRFFRFVLAYEPIKWDFW